MDLLKVWHLILQGFNKPPPDLPATPGAPDENPMQSNVRTKIISHSLVRRMGPYVCRPERRLGKGAGAGS